MKDIVKKLLKVFKSIIVIASMFFIPLFLSELFIKIGLKSEAISELIALTIYLVLVSLLFLKDLKVEFKRFKSNFKKCMDTGFKYWMLGLVIMFVSNIIINLIIFKGNIAANEELNRQALMGNPVYTILSAALLGPIIEELLFRKNMDGIFKNKYVFAIISGLLFGFMHTIADLSNILNLLYIIPYGGLGFAFAMMYKETNTTLTNIVMHMLHNLITCLLVLAVL